MEPLRRKYVWQCICCNHSCLELLLSRACSKWVTYQNHSNPIMLTSPCNGLTDLAKRVQPTPVVDATLALPTPLKERGDLHPNPFGLSRLAPARVSNCNLLLQWSYPYSSPHQCTSLSATWHTSLKQAWKNRQIRNVRAFSSHPSIHLSWIGWKLWCMHRAYNLSMLTWMPSWVPLGSIMWITWWWINKHRQLFTCPSLPQFFCVLSWGVERTPRSEQLGWHWAAGLAVRTAQCGEHHQLCASLPINTGSLAWMQGLRKICEWLAALYGGNARLNTKC